MSKRPGSSGYSGTPLPRKLGIKPGATVALVAAPAGIEETLGELPDGASLRRSARGKPDLALWFVISRRQLAAEVASRARLAANDGLWIAWPKKSAGIETDVTRETVRELALAHGLVDYKVCAIDDTWSGLKFALRKEG